MSYIELQETARRNTRRLVLLLSGAVTLIVLELFLILRPTDRSGWTLADDIEIFLKIGAFTLVFIGLFALYKAYRLSDGGPAVAEMLGGRAIPADTSYTAERRLRNVVEEMAIASGLPVPAIYVLDHEDGMNALTAGLTPENAAVAVTRGLLLGLDRDELQGVVAHEFAHIRNGDMRLNTRLLALQFGILAIGMIGLGMLLAASQIRPRRKEDQGLQAGFMLAGAVLAAIGFLGVLKARLIQAAVSRQREFLADASAVEFTRNPDGLASALRKIGAAGSQLRTAHASEVGHLLFGEGKRSFLSRVFATHPPIEERIRRLQGR